MIWQNTINFKSDLIWVFALRLRVKRREGWLGTPQAEGFLAQFRPRVATKSGATRKYRLVESCRPYFSIRMPSADLTSKRQAAREVIDILSEISVLLVEVQPSSS